MAASEAGYDIPREGTRYTGTMRAHFSQAGFAVLPFKGDFQRYPAGSIYLSDKGHTEMDLGDCLGGARIDECGGIAGAVPGDQSGGEVSICAKYDYPWDWVLVPADCVPGGLKNPRYRVKTKEHGWLPWMEGLKSLDGSLDDFAGASGVPAVGFDIDWNAGSGWFRLWTLDHPEGLDKGNTGDGSSICAIAIYYDTQNPDETGWLKAKYRVSAVGCDYFKWEYDDEDIYAGDGESPIDRVQLVLVES